MRRGERIGVVGPNGSGQDARSSSSSPGGARPRTGARSSAAPTCRRGTSTSTSARSTQRSPRSTTCAASAGDFTVEAARQYLARFRFWGDDPLRVVSGFSGGERSRLALAKLLLEPKNLLFLDEPTNHLDIPAAEILEEALVGFEGTVLLVSHDRRFLENVTTRIVSIRDGAADVYPGGFKDYEHAAGRRRRPPPKAGKEEKPRPVARGRRGRRGSRSSAPAARDLEKKKRRIQELEASIATGEKDLDALRAKLKASPSDDWEKLAKMAQEEQALTKKVDSMLVEWARLSEEVK